MLVAIPHYNDFEGLKTCIKSFLKSTNYRDFHLLINNSDNRYTRRIQTFLQKLPKGFSIELLETKKEGPLIAYNKIFEIAKERKQDLFLTQTDVYFPKCKKDWFAEMQLISKREECGMATCWGGGGISGPDFINGFQWVGAWCTYIPYKTIEKIGGYDMNIPLGYGVDIDYTMGVINAGFRIYNTDYWVQHMPNYKENHEHEKTDNFEIIKRDAYIYMRRKWKIGEYAQ